jgi:hypothetical protein
VEATASFYFASVCCGSGKGTVRLLRKKTGAALPSANPIVLDPGIDTTQDWETIEEHGDVVGSDDAPRWYTVPRTPLAFIASPDVIYAVAVHYDASLSGRYIDWKTYIGQQLPVENCASASA